MKSFLLKLNAIVLLGFFFITQIASAQISNPLGQTKTLQDLITALLDILIEIGALVVVVFVIISGLKIVMARGAPEDLQKAKAMLWYTLIGGAVVLGAKAIQLVIENTVNQLK